MAKSQTNTRRARQPEPEPAEAEEEQPPFDTAEQAEAANMPSAGQVAVQSGGRAVGAVVDHFKSHQEEARNLRAGRIFLKFSKGDWVIGREADEFPDNEFYFIPGMDLFEKGWQCWKGGRPVDERFVQYGTPAPQEDDLPDHSPYPGNNDGWQSSIKFPLIIVPYNKKGGDIAYMNVEFASSSSGGQQAIYSLSKQFSEKIKLGEVEPGKREHVLVHASSDHYMHKEWGKVHTPVFKVLAVLNQAEVAKLIQGAKEVRKPASGEREDPDDVQAKPKGNGRLRAIGKAAAADSLDKGRARAPAAAAGNAAKRTIRRI